MLFWGLAQFALILLADFLKPALISPKYRGKKGSTWYQLPGGRSIQGPLVTDLVWRLPDNQPRASVHCFAWSLRAAPGLDILKAALLEEPPFGLPVKETIPPKPRDHHPSLSTWGSAPTDAQITLVETWWGHLLLGVESGGARKLPKSQFVSAWRVQRRS